MEEQPKRKPNWNYERIQAVIRIHQEVRNELPPLGENHMRGLLKSWSMTEPKESNGNWGGAYVDVEEGGEIKFDIPPMEEWEEQYRNFLFDEFSAKKQGYSFKFYLKHYGRWKPQEPSKRQATDPELKHQCACGCVATAKRSQWLRYRDKTLKCRECPLTYNVNDILGQLPTLRNIIPIKN